MIVEWGFSLAPPILVFIYQQFPSNRYAFLLAFLMTLPAYYLLGAELWNSPRQDRHGYGFIWLAGLLLPAVIGNLTRGIVLWRSAKRGSVREKAVLTIIGFLILCFSVYFVPKWITKPFEIPNLNQEKVIK